MAAARLQGTAPSWRSLLELLWPGIATALRRGTGATAASEPEAPDRSDGESSNNRNLHVNAQCEGKVVVQVGSRVERGHGEAA